MAQIQNSTDIFGVSSYIVDPTSGQGTHTTIGAALTAASAASFQGDIFIRPGTYTENPALVAGINLVGWTSDCIGTVTINGTCTFSSAGTVTLANLYLSNASTYAVSITGSAASIVDLINCGIASSSAVGINYSSSSASSQVNLYKCTAFFSTGSGLFAHSSAGQMTIYHTTNSDSTISNSASTISGTGGFNAAFSSLQSLSFSNGTANNLFLCDIDTGNNVTGLTTSGSGTSVKCVNCYIAGGTSSAISAGASSTVSLYNCTVGSTNTNAIAGSGTVIASSVSFSGTSSNISTTTQTYPNQAPIQTTGIGIGATPGTTAGLTFDGFNFMNNYVYNGTFSPTFNGSAAGTTTYTTQVGFYMRIGNFCYLMASVAGSASTGTGTATIGSLPFTIKNQTGYRVPSALLSTASATWPTSTTSLCGQAVTNTTTIIFYCSGTGTGGGNLQMANVAFNWQASSGYQI